MYTAAQTPTYLVDHEHLTCLVNALAPEHAKCVVIGYGEYAKHLVNFYKDKIVCIFDPRVIFDGIRFRGVPVTASIGRQEGVNLILCAEYEFLFDFLPRVLDVFPGIPHVVPPRMHYKPSNDVNVFEQEDLYKSIKRDEVDAPATMMGKEKINFLVELLRFGLTKTGCIVEMGSWQGGSTWYMAKTLSYLRETRPLYMLDLFEDHMMDPTATMCSDEIRKRMNVYDHTVMIQGLVNDPSCLDQIKTSQICFAHMDLGPEMEALDYIWTHLSPGAPLLLDNYGHLLAPPWAFDRYIEARGARIIRFPWSEQGLTFKPC